MIALEGNGDTLSHYSYKIFQVFLPFPVILNVSYKRLKNGPMVLEKIGRLADVISLGPD